MYRGTHKRTRDSHTPQPSKKIYSFVLSNIFFGNEKGIFILPVGWSELFISCILVDYLSRSREYSEYLCLIQEIKSAFGIRDSYFSIILHTQGVKTVYPFPQCEVSTESNFPNRSFSHDTRPWCIIRLVDSKGL